MKLLGVTLDYRLGFDPYASNLWKKAATQLNVLLEDTPVKGFLQGH